METDEMIDFEDSGLLDNTTFDASDGALVLSPGLSPLLQPDDAPGRASAPSPEPMELDPPEAGPSSGRFGTVMRAPRRLMSDRKPISTSTNSPSLQIGDTFRSRLEFDRACRAFGRLTDPTFEGLSIIESNGEHEDVLDFCCTGVKGFKRGSPAHSSVYCSWRVRADMSYDDDGNVDRIIVRSFLPHEEEDEPPAHSCETLNTFNVYAEHPHLGLTFDSIIDLRKFLKTKVCDSHINASVSAGRSAWTAHCVVKDSARRRTCPFRVNFERDCLDRWVIWLVSLEHSEQCQQFRNGEVAAFTGNVAKSRANGRIEDSDDSDDSESAYEAKVAPRARHSKPSKPSKPAQSLDTVLRLGQTFRSRQAFDAACRAHGRKDDTSFDGITLLEEGGTDYDYLDFVCTRVKGFQRGRRACSWKVRAKLAYHDARSISSITIVRFWPDSELPPKHSKHDRDCDVLSDPHRDLWRTYDTLDVAFISIERLAAPSPVSYLGSLTGKRVITIACPGGNASCKHPCPYRYRLERNCFGEWTVWSVTPQHSTGCVHEVKAIESDRPKRLVVKEEDGDGIGTARHARSPGPALSSRSVSPELHVDKKPRLSSTAQSKTLVKPAERPKWSIKAFENIQELPQEVIDLLEYLTPHSRSPHLLALTEHLVEMDVSAADIESLTSQELDDLLQHELPSSLRFAAVSLHRNLAQALGLPLRPAIFEQEQVVAYERARRPRQIVAALHPSLDQPHVLDAIDGCGLKLAEMREADYEAGDVLWEKLAGELSVLERVLLRRRLGVWHSSLKSVPLGCR